MSAESRDLVTWVVLTLVGMCTLVGFAVRFILVPWLREHLVSPMAQVEKQVTENKHSNRMPTVLDRIDDVHVTVTQLADLEAEARRDREHLAAELQATVRRLDLHLGWSHEEANRLWQAIVTGYDPFNVKGDNKDETTS